jgi:hypothetical protein
MVLAAASVLLCGFAPQAPPSFLARPFGDSADWITGEDMVYTIGTTTEKIIVPKGFVTDFASIPKPLWSLGLSPEGQYTRAAVIHDYLYWAQGCTRAQSDHLLVIAMKESAVGSFDEFVIFEGVDIGGSGAWLTNAKERREGLPKIVPAQDLAPPDPNMNWNTYRQILFKKGVRDPSFQVNPSYCRFGNSTDVPKGKTG